MRNASKNPAKFADAAAKLKTTKLPLILCSFDPEAMKAALEKVGDERPLIYAVNETNIEEMTAWPWNITALYVYLHPMTWKK